MQRGWMTPLSEGVSVWVVSVLEDVCLGCLCLRRGALSRGLSVEGALSGGSLSRGVSVWGFSVHYGGSLKHL